MVKWFPKDCGLCPHLHSWDMSVDDWTNVCDVLQRQIDDCDSDFIGLPCPLQETQEEEVNESTTN